MGRGKKWSYRGKDRRALLVTPDRVSIGQRVWWTRVHYYKGVPEFYRWMGLVEVVHRGSWVTVRDRYGHEFRVAVKDLMVEKAKPT